jgi:drug/metabolite transporter (DMT)-like permease
MATSPELSATRPATSGTVAAGGAKPVPRGFFNPYVQMGVGALLVTASELLLKKGASSVGGDSLLGLQALASAWTWLGIVTYVLSFASWLYVLRFVPLGVAFAMINVVHVLVPVGSWLLLGEQISSRRWLGITLVLLGILLVARTVADAEEKL